MSLKWFEMIHLRTTERRTARLIQTVERLVNEVSEQKNTQVIKMYRSAGLDTDLSLHLFHDSVRLANEGSQLGICIAQAFKPFGMVRHSVWVEIPKR